MNEIILNIETSTKVCSVAISQGEAVLSIVESLDENYSHAEKLNLSIEEALAKAKLKMKDLDAISVSKGPGSFTGLRIGVSSAKGFAYALSKPLIACDTLDSLSKGYITKSNISEKDLVIPMIDARRSEVYMKIKDASSKTISEIEAKVIDSNSFDHLEKENRTIHLIGDGASKFSGLFSDSSNIKVHADFHASASYMTPLSYRSFIANKFEDLAYFEPFYLKDFVAIKPRKIF